MHLLKPGDEVLTAPDIYGGAMGYFMHEATENQGINFKLVDYQKLDEVEKHIGPKTKFLYLESPSNPILKIYDIAKVAILAKKHSLKLIVDNTFLSPYFQNPLKLGADIVIHSCTKSIGGHSDLIMGAVCTNDPEVNGKMVSIQKSLGACAGPFECYLAMRGIKTLGIRMKASAESALKLAEYLQSRTDKVSNVYYPGLSTHPLHDI